MFIQERKRPVLEFLMMMSRLAGLLVSAREKRALDYTTTLSIFDRDWAMFVCLLQLSNSSTFLKAGKACG